MSGADAVSTGPTRPAEPMGHDRLGPVRLSAIGLGCLGIGWGMWQLFVVAPSATRPFAALLWLAGALLAHDALLAPLTVVAGVAVAKSLGPHRRRMVAGLALAVASLALVAAPRWLGS